MHGASFTDYKTYEWAPVKNTKHPFYTQYVGMYVNYQLETKKGLKRVSAGQSPDLIATYVFQTRQTMDTNSTYFGDGGWGGWGGWGWGGMGMGGMGFGTTTQSPRTTGLLTVALYDTRAKITVWRGQAFVDDVVKDSHGEQKQVAKSVEKMFRKFPPPKYD